MPCSHIVCVCVLSTASNEARQHGARAPGSRMEQMFVSATDALPAMKAGQQALKRQLVNAAQCVCTVTASNEAEQQAPERQV